MLKMITLSNILWKEKCQHQLINEGGNEMALGHTSEYGIWIRRAFLKNSNILLDQIFSLQNFNSNNSLSNGNKVHSIYVNKEQSWI